MLAFLGQQLKGDIKSMMAEVFTSRTSVVSSHMKKVSKPTGSMFQDGPKKSTSETKGAISGEKNLPCLNSAESSELEI
jgi:hypothetical protein